MIGGDNPFNRFTQAQQELLAGLGVRNAPDLAAIDPPGAEHAIRRLAIRQHPRDRRRRPPGARAGAAIPPAPGVLEHVVMDGERLDQLAGRFYGDATRSWLMLDANPAELNPLALLRPGRRIAVPANRAVDR